MRTAVCLAALSLVFGFSQTARAQFQTQTGGGGTTGQTGQTGQQFTQSGQSENFTIQRNANESVASANVNFLSRASAPGTTTSTFGSVAGFGGLSGFSAGSLTSSLTSASAIGGGIGRGLGNQFGGIGGQQLGRTGAAGATGSSTAMPIRHRIRVDVARAPIASTRVSGMFARRLNKLPGLDSAASVSVTMDGTTVLLTGEVASERERDLIGRLAMLEPGIAAVQNDLTVQGAVAQQELQLPVPTGAATP